MRSVKLINKISTVKGLGIMVERMSAHGFLATVKDMMAHEPVMHHPFLTEFERQVLDGRQLRRFAIQWYKTARAHKEAFPAIIYNTPDDDVRMELIDILYEEYGRGDREKVHANMLRRFLDALGITESDILNTEALPAVRQFSEEVKRIWRDGDPARAFGLHFALEFLASSLHVHFANGLQKYQTFTARDLEYFTYHKTAEQRHADYSESGFLLYASYPENRPLLEEGVTQGIDLLRDLWEGFYQYVFQSTCCSAL